MWVEKDKISYRTQYVTNLAQWAKKRKFCTIYEVRTHLKNSFFNIVKELCTFQLCHNYKKASGHKNEQLLYFTVFSGTNGIEVTIF